MSLSGLSAAELAQIDQLCLQFETQLRQGSSVKPDEIISQYAGDHESVLRAELLAIEQEVLGQSHGPAATVTQYAGNDSTSPPSEAFMLPAIGTRMGPYLIEKTIGRGGMGVVFAAHDDRLNRKVAIKMLGPSLAVRRDLRERFQREARAVAAISHPNIVELFDVGLFGQVPYAVMEFLDGTLMETKLAQGPLSVKEVRRLGAQIAEGLATVHQAGIVHRDLKPQNIMLVSRSESPSSPVMAKLFDFGLFRLAPSMTINEPQPDHEQTPGQEKGLRQTDDRTREGVILGTPGYMAPEQAVGESVTSAADVFSLGCVLYEAFYGKRAFDGPTVSSRITAVIRSDPNFDLGQREQDPKLAKLIEQCLDKNPLARPSSRVVADELLQTVSQFSSGEAFDRNRDSKIAAAASDQRFSRRNWVAMTAVGVAGAAVLSWGWLARSNARSNANQLRDITSIGVLSFAQAGTSESDDRSLQPVGARQLGDGDHLAALLVHELARLDSLAVPSFRPIAAPTNPDDFRKLGKRMEVDALLTGTITPMPGNEGGDQPVWQLDLQLISSATGLQIWGQRSRTVAGEHLIEQTLLASEIASVIGRELTASANQQTPPVQETFHCLVQGRMRSDPDSIAGLRRALDCFERAHRVDPNYPDPVAGIALTSITLAGQSDRDEAIQLVERARQNSETALRQQRSSVDARLAAAMLQWQTLGHYDEAELILKELLMFAPNRWQIHHQYGLLKVATGQTADAIGLLREASLLNPVSLIVKVDLARAYWFDGKVDRAIEDAEILRDRFSDETMETGSNMPRGLLIDIYEQRNELAKASAEDPQFPSDIDVGDRSEYFQARKTRLNPMPYGPFGNSVNELIWSSRSTTLDDRALARYLDPWPPMLPLVLGAHPSLAEQRKLPRAQEVLLTSRPRTASSMLSGTPTTMGSSDS